MAISSNPTPTGDGLDISGEDFQVGLTGLDRQGMPITLQDNEVLLLSPKGRLRAEGDGYRPGSVIKVLVVEPDGSQTPIGDMRVDSMGRFVSSLSLTSLSSLTGDRVVQFAGVTPDNTERVLSLGARVLTRNASLTLIAGKRVDLKGPLDRIRATGTTVDVPAGTKLVPYIRYGNKGAFQRGVATIVVQDDGTFRWTRKITNGKALQAYVSFASSTSNTVKWRRIR